MDLGSEVDLHLIAPNLARSSGCSNLSFRICVPCIASCKVHQVAVTSDDLLSRTAILTRLSLARMAVAR